MAQDSAFDRIVELVIKHWGRGTAAQEAAARAEMHRAAGNLTLAAAWQDLARAIPLRGDGHAA